MTKEDLIFELKRRCSFWLNNKTISKKHALECLLGIIESEESQLSLPTNLDEAARRYAIPPYMIDIDESHLDEYPYSKEAEMAFKAGAEWATNGLFENNRLRDCEALSEEDYNLESNFVDAHIKENQRIPTFLDAIKYGAKWMASVGETKEGLVVDRDEYIKFEDGTYIDLCPTLDKNAFDLYNGEKVIVQIRKK